MATSSHNTSDKEISELRTAGNCTIDVKFHLRFADDHPVHCHVVYQKQDSTWEWNVNLFHENLLNDILKMVSTVPENLATAVAIQKEQQHEDGDYLVENFVHCIRRYQATANSLIENINKRGEIERNIFSFSNGNPPRPHARSLELAESLGQYLAKWEVFRASLPSRNLDAIQKQAKELLVESEEIKTCCRVVLDFAFPIWSAVYRMGVWHEENIAHFRQRLVRKLIAGSGLCQAYSKMSYLIANN